jgi:hypothetical protein
MSVNYDELPVLAALRFNEGATFALPIFQDPADPNHCLVQEIDERLDLVIGFKVLDGDTSAAIAPRNRAVSIVGKPQIYVFVTEDGCAHAGPLSELETTLRTFVIAHPNHPAVCLQIAELIGTLEEKREARQQMTRVIAERSGSGAAQAFYQGSVLRKVLWDHLLAAAPNGAAAARILLARRRLGLNIAKDGVVTLDLSSLDPADYRNSEAELLREISNEFTRFENVLPADAFLQPIDESKQRRRSLRQWFGKAFGLMPSGKRLVVLGPAGVGKTRLIDFLTHQYRPRPIPDVLSRIRIQVTRGRKFRFRGLLLNIKYTLDVPDATYNYDLWKKACDRADVILYLVRADRLMARDKQHEDRVKDDMHHIMQWLYPARSKADFFIVGTHCDLDPAFNTCLSEGKLGIYVGRFHELEIVKYLVSMTGGTSKINLLLGSMMDKQSTEQLVFQIFQRIAS